MNHSRLTYSRATAPIIGLTILLVLTKTIAIADVTAARAAGPAPDIMILGAVASPGPMRLSGITTLGRIIEAAGGLSRQADAAGIVVMEDGCRNVVDFRLIQSGRRPDIRVRAPATVLVPGRPRVFIGGDVRNSGWATAGTLVEAVEASDPILEEDLEVVTIEKATGETFQIDYAEITDLNEPDILLDEGDSVTVQPPDLYPIRISGWVENPGVYRRSSISAAIAAARPREGALDSVYVFDASSSASTSEPGIATPASLNHPAPIPIDIEVPRLPMIRVVGEVQNPGAYFARDVESAIAQAGGPTPGANLAALAFIDRFNRASAADTSTAVRADGMLFVPSLPLVFGEPSQRPDALPLPRRR